MTEAAGLLATISRPCRIRSGPEGAPRSRQSKPQAPASPPAQSRFHSPRARSIWSTRSISSSSSCSRSSSEAPGVADASPAALLPPVPAASRLSLMSAIRLPRSTMADFRASSSQRRSASDSGRGAEVLSWCRMLHSNSPAAHSNSDTSGSAYTVRRRLPRRTPGRQDASTPFHSAWSAMVAHFGSNRNLATVEQCKVTTERRGREVSEML